MEQDITEHSTCDVSISSKTQPNASPLPSRTNISVVILAGGRSQRMGQPKARLPFDSSQTFLDRLVSVYESVGVRQIVIVLPVDAGLDECTARYPGAMIVQHRDPEASRLDSVRLGLSAVRDESAVFLQDSDRPFVEREILDALQQSLPRDGYASPSFGGHAGHPLLLSVSTVKDLGNQLESPYLDRNKTLRDLLRPYPRTLVSIGEAKSEININTPQEYERLFGHFPSMSPSVSHSA